MVKLKFGPLTISLSGRGPVYDAVHDELSTLPEGTGNEVDIGFRFVDEIKVSRQTVHVGPWRLADQFVSGSGHGYAYSIVRNGEVLEVSIAPTSHEDDGALYTYYRQTWDWNFLTPAETVAKNIMYNLFDLVTGAVFLRRRASYLHASTCARGDEALALIAWGGVGKTTSVLKLVTEDDWRFMSDDLGLVDADGMLWRTPKHLQVYAYNVAGQPELFDRLMEGRGVADHINWRWRKARFGEKKVRRRISAEELFGAQNITDSAPITEAVFLERTDCRKVHWKDVTVDELALQSSTILIDELNALFELVVAAESHGIDIGMGTLEELRRDSREVLASAFDGIPTNRLQIPVNTGPDELAEALRNRP